MLRAFALSGLFLSQALTISCQNPSETPLSVNTGPYQRQEQSRIGINQWGYYPNSKKTIIHDTLHVVITFVAFHAEYLSININKIMTMFHVKAHVVK